MMKQWIYALILVIIISNLLLAENFIIPPGEFKKHGVNYRLLDPINLSYKGDYFVALEPITDPRIKAKGFVRKLHVIRFNGNRVARVDSVKVPITNLANSAVSDRKNEVYIAGNHGNRIVRIDLDKMQPRILFDFRKNRKGFKADGFLFCDRGSFYATGWFYDAQKYWKGDYLVKLLPSKKGKLRFRKQVNLTKLYKESFPQGVVRVYYYHSGDQIFFNVIKPRERKVYLMMYRKRKIVPIDSGYKLNLFIGNHRKVFYSVHYKPRQQVQHFVRDLNSNKKWQIGKSGDPYTYPFFSQKGDVLVVVKFYRRLKKMDALYGLEKENYKLKRFIGLQTMGPMKFSGNGKAYLLLGPQGLLHGKLDY